MMAGICGTERGNVREEREREREAKEGKGEREEEIWVNVYLPFSLGYDHLRLKRWRPRGFLLTLRFLHDDTLVGSHYRHGSVVVRLI